MSSETVRVRRQWSDPNIATYRIEDLHALHWSQTSGGTGAHAPREFLSGYVLCDGMIAGELAHSCRHGRAPHRIKVCVTIKDNPPPVYATLLRRMDWESRLRACPYLVDCPSPAPPPDQLAQMERWLDGHWRADGYLTIGFGAGGGRAAVARPQIWLSSFAVAKSFAAIFGLRSRGHQNQDKQRKMAMLLAASG